MEQIEICSMLLNNKEIKRLRFIQHFHDHIIRINFNNIRYKMYKLILMLDDIIYQLVYYILPTYVTNIIKDPQQLFTCFCIFNKDLNNGIAVAINKNFFNNSIYQSLKNFKILRNLLTHNKIITKNTNNVMLNLDNDIANLLSNVISKIRIDKQNNIKINGFFCYILTNLVTVYQKTIKLWYRNLKNYIDSYKFNDLTIKLKIDNVNISKIKSCSIKLIKSTQQINNEIEVLVDNKIHFNKLTNYHYIPRKIIDNQEKYKIVAINNLKYFKSNEMLEKSILDKDKLPIHIGSLLIITEGKWKNFLVIFLRYNGSSTYFYVFDKEERTIAIPNKVNIILLK